MAMIRYTYDIDLKECVRKLNGKYDEEIQIVCGLEDGRNVEFEYATSDDARKARARIAAVLREKGVKVGVCVTSDTKICVVRK